MANKVYCGNLSWNATEEDLHEAFGKFGAITEAKVITDRDTGRSKGFAFITFENSTAANKAVDGMTDQHILDRPVRVSIAEERARRTNNRDDRRGGGYRDNNY